MLVYMLAVTAAGAESEIAYGEHTEQTQGSISQQTDHDENIRTNAGEIIMISSLEHQRNTAETIVYYTSEITPEAMVCIYNALGVQLTGDNIAVKLSTGEPPASNYLDPDLIADLVHQVNGTIVENTTAYGGQRASTAMHYQVAEDHGFTDIADFVGVRRLFGSLALQRSRHGWFRRSNQEHLHRSWIQRRQVPDSHGRKESYQPLGRRTGSVS